MVFYLQGKLNKTLTRQQLKNAIYGLEARHFKKKTNTGNENGFLETFRKNIKERQNPKAKIKIKKITYELLFWII